MNEEQLIYEITKAVRADPNWRHVPVIMITATGGADLVRSLEAGADDFVSKPFDKNELLARVKSLIRVKRYHDDLADALEHQTAIGDVLKEVGRAYRRHMGTHYPAMALVEVARLLEEGALVEIEAEAIL